MKASKSIKYLATTLCLSLAGMAAITVAACGSSQASIAAEAAKKQKIEAEESFAKLLEKNFNVDEYIVSRFKGDWLVRFLEKAELDQKGIYFVTSNGNSWTNPVFEIMVQTGHKPKVNESNNYVFDKSFYYRAKRLFAEGFARFNNVFFGESAQLEIDFVDRSEGEYSWSGTQLAVKTATPGLLAESVRKFNELIKSSENGGEGIHKIVQEMFGYFTSQTITYKIKAGIGAEEEARYIAEKRRSLYDSIAYVYEKEDDYRYESFKILSKSFAFAGDSAVYAQQFWKKTSYYLTGLGEYPDPRRIGDFKDGGNYYKSRGISYQIYFLVV